MKAVKKASNGTIVNGKGDPKYTKTKTKLNNEKKKKEAPKSFSMTITPKDPKMDLPGMAKVMYDLGLIGGKGSVAYTKTKTKKS